MLRSFLFVPAIAQRFIEKAPSVPADAIILDLEASIPAAKKDEARAQLTHAASRIRAESDQQVFVRINARELADVEAATAAKVDGIVIPSVETCDDLSFYHNAAIYTRGAADLRVFPIVETPLGLLNLSDIAAFKPKPAALLYGTGDLLKRLGPFAADSQEALLPGAWQVAIAARAHGLVPYGLPGTLGRFDDPDAFRTICKQARNIGMMGSPGIHPNHIAIINEVFTPSIEEIDRAQKIVAAFEEAGRVAISFEGLLVDETNYDQYLDLIRLADDS